MQGFQCTEVGVEGGTEGKVKGETLPPNLPLLNGIAERVSKWDYSNDSRAQGHK